MNKGDVVILPDPRLLWEKLVLSNITEYNALSLIREAKSKYGLVWIGYVFNPNNAVKYLSKYKIIDEMKYDYFCVKFSDLLDSE
jgi:hypothetical protein